MNLRWPRLKRQPAHLTTRDRMIEDRLLDGDQITLRLADELAVRVGIDGLTLVVTQEHPLPDDQARTLLLTARYAATFPRQEPQPQPEPEPDGDHVIPVRLTPRQNQHVGDVLAAYFRLNSQD